MARGTRSDIGHTPEYHGDTWTSKQRASIFIILYDPLRIHGWGIRRAEAKNLLGRTPQSCTSALIKTTGKFVTFNRPKVPKIKYPDALYRSGTEVTPQDLWVLFRGTMLEDKHTNSHGRKFGAYKSEWLSLVLARRLKETKEIQIDLIEKYKSPWDEEFKSKLNLKGKDQMFADELHTALKKNCRIITSTTIGHLTNQQKEWLKEIAEND